MRAFLQTIITELVLKDKNRGTDDEGQYSDYALAKGFRELKITLSTGLKDVFLVLLGITSAAFGLEGFLLTNKFIDGGATGISLLISEKTGMPLYILLLLVNIPFIWLGAKVIGRSFAIKTALAITALAICLAVFQFPDITKDNLLVAVFGGFFLGAGIGLAIRGGAVIDGTEILAIFLSRKLGTTIGDVIVGINVVIFSTAAYLFNVEMALYSMITYLCASKTLDFIIEGIDEYTGVTIVSTHNDEIREMITHEMGRGITVYKGKRGFGSSGEKKDIDILYTVITRLELNKLKLEILKIDPHAFVVMHSVKDTKGGMIKKRALK